MVVVAILIALAAIALPSLSGWADNQRLKGVARDLVTHFQLARLEAVKRSTTVVLTFNPGGPHSGNYTVFVDDGSGGGTANNLTQDNEAEETLARTIMPFGVTLTSTTFTADRAGYNSRGFPVGSSFTATEGKITVANEDRSYEVIIQRTSGGLSLAGPK
jgi:Tfp pilus assembly protein FimT